GPRTLDEADGLVERLNDVAALAGPSTTGPGGFRFAESGVAEALGVPTLLVDPNPGPGAVAAGLDDAAERLGCDLIVMLDGARGGLGTTAIRDGRRAVELGPAGALTFYLDPAACLASAAHLAAAVVDAGSLADADAILTARGVRTELAA